VFSIGLAVTAVLAAQATLRADSFVTADGVRLHYYTKGSGPPLVLVHGFALSAQVNWIGPGTVDSLASQFTVVAPDLRGHGRSDKPHDPGVYGARLVDDLVAVLDHLKIPRAHVAGYSLGSRIGLRLLASHPDRVMSLVLGGAGWGAPGQPPPPFVVKWIENLDRAAREGTSVGAALAVPEFPPVPPAVRAMLDRNDPAALSAMIKSMGATSVPEAELRLIQRPVHAVIGEHDAGARAAVAALITVLPRVRQTIIAGADHAQAMGDPRLALAIRDFALAN
jgi:pimeloyl-ACP methyl ester carboxylesterase